MNLNPYALYKVIEIDRGIAIINAADRSAHPQQVELILGDPITCVEYLSRYAHARMHGLKNKAQAHEIAKAGLPFVRAWSPK